MLQSMNVSFDLKVVANGSVIEAIRTQVAHQFMSSKYNRLFMIDSDISWEPPDFIRLLALSTKMAVVGATYTMKRETPAFAIHAESTKLAANKYGCLEVEGMGLGFTCVQRPVIERLAERAPKLRFEFAAEPVPHIFRCDSLDGRFRGEDMAFFADCRGLGYKVNLEPNITLTHHGHKGYRASFTEKFAK